VSGPLAVFRREAIYNYIPAWTEDRFLGQEFRFATDRTMTGFVLGSLYIDKRLKERHASSPFVTRVNYEPRNWKIVYCKAARAWTEVPDTFQRMIKQQIRWKKSFIRNIFFTGAIYWRRPLIPALFYYLHIVFVLLGPIISFRHLIYMPLTGDVLSALLYLSGIIFIGLVFGIAFRMEEKRSSRWMYRPLMSLLSTFLLSWLIFYSALTIRKMVWTRD
jgi:cellulose synthase/poly-beta-1,6-N-acetylglucosamine synthase-like glycosyltransferase